MCNRTSFDILLDFGSVAEEFMLDCYDLSSLRLNHKELTSAGLLRKRPIGKTVRCRDCDSSIPVTAWEKKTGIVLYGDCPECGYYELEPEEQILWKIDYTPLFEAARRVLSCSGEITEVVPNALWNLGRAPLAGQSREIFACAGINTDRNAEIMPRLPDGKTPVLLVLGNAAKPEKLGTFNPDHVFNFSQLARMENGEIVFDSTHIQMNAGIPASYDEGMKKAPGRNSMIGDIIIKLKAELREFMRGVYSDFEQAEKSGREPVFDGIKQNQLAVLVGVTPVVVNRALKKDLELKALFDTANNPQTAYAYGRKAQR